MEEMPTLLWLPACAFAGTVLLIAAAMRVFPRWGLLDFPERYGLNRKRLPYPVGIAAVITFLAVFILYMPLNQQNTGLILGIVLLAGIAYIDDRRPLPALPRFGVQIAVALLIFATGTRIYTITNPMGGIISLDTFIIPWALFRNPPVWSGIFTVLWLLLTINALNWFDGIPGQVSLLSTIGFLTIGALALSPRIAHMDPQMQKALATLAFSLAGVSGACLMFDFPPNRILLGDTGSMFFGLMLGVLTIYAGGKVATAFLVLGVPLIDSGIVIVRRMMQGRLPWHGSTQGEHLHHRLRQCGWSQRHIIALTAVMGAILGTAALFLSTREKFLAALILMTIMLCLSLYTERCMHIATDTPSEH